MRICQVIDEYFPPEKGYTSPYYYSKKLCGLGHEVEVFCGRRKGELEKEVVAGVTVFRTPFEYKWSNRIHSIFFSFFVLKKLLQRKTCDIVHIYYFSMSFFIHLFLRIQNSAVHICDIRSVPLKRLTFGRILRRAAAFWADSLLVLDDEIFNKIFDKSSKIPYFSVPLGVETAIFKNKQNKKKKKEIRNKLGFDSETILCVTIGSLDRKRKQSDVLKAFSIAHEKNHKLGLLVIGDGQEKKNLQILAKQLNVDKIVIFLGLIPHEKIPFYLSVCNIGLTYLPITLFNVQPPTKTIEYLSAGLSVIATDTQGNRKFKINSCKLKLIKDDIVSLSEELVNLSSDLNRSEYIELPSAINEFDWHHIVEKTLVPTYKKLIKQKSGS